MIFSSSVLVILVLFVLWFAELFENLFFSTISHLGGFLLCIHFHKLESPLFLVADVDVVLVGLPFSIMLMKMATTCDFNRSDNQLHKISVLSYIWVDEIQRSF